MSRSRNELADRNSSGRRIRIDAYDNHPPDTGCHVHHSCLSCPLSECILIRPLSTPLSRTDAAARAALTLSRSGNTPPDIAAFLGCSPRTVYRLLSRARAL